MIWGTDGTRTVGSYCGRVRAFLDRLGHLFRPDPEVVPQPQPLPAPPPQPLPNPGDGLAGDPPPSVGSTDSPERDSPGIVQRLQALADRLRESETAQRAESRALSERLKLVEAAAGMVAQLRQRVEAAEAIVGAENVRGVVREVAAELIAERGPAAVEAWLPRLLTALGWSGPPSVALMLAAHAAVRLVARRVRRKARQKQEATSAD